MPSYPGCVLRQWTRWIVYPLVWLLAMVVPMAAYAWANGPGPAGRFTIDSFHVFYKASRAADRVTVQVTETITAEFPTEDVNHGLVRRIPTQYQGQDMAVGGFMVTNEVGTSLPYTTITSEGTTTLRIGDPSIYVHGPTTYVITYDIGKAMVRTPLMQGLYLDVNGTGWDQDMNDVSATLVVDDELAGQLNGTTACYYGYAGATETCRMEHFGTAFSTQTVPAAAHQTMTIAIGFNPGTVPTAIDLPTGSFRIPLTWQIAALPIFAGLLLGLAFLLRRRMSRQASDIAIETRYTPPEGISPLVAADFLGVPERGVAAQLCDLVLKGQAEVTAEETPTGTAPQPRDGLGPLQRGKLRRLLKVGLTDGAAIRPHALKDFSEKLFGSWKHPRSLEFIAADPSVQADRDSLFAMAGLRKDAVAPALILTLGMVALVLGGWAILWQNPRGLEWWLIGAGLLAVLLLVEAVHLAPRYGKLTDAGRKALSELLGLKQFVTMAEGERIRWMQNALDAPRRGAPDDVTSRVELYEPLLPYAILFGCEKTWADALGSLYDTFPEASLPSFAPRLTIDWTGMGASDPDASYRRRLSSSDDTYWATRPTWGDGALARGWSSFTSSVGDSWREYRDSREDNAGDGGGSSWSSHSSSSSGSSDGSSGFGGSAGGGMGGGGGGGW